jgi:hypothetical protein
MLLIELAAVSSCAFNGAAGGSERVFYGAAPEASWQSQTRASYFSAGPTRGYDEHACSCVSVTPVAADREINKGAQMFRLLSILGTGMALFAAVNTSPDPGHRDQNVSPVTADHVLSWLPLDTETVIVARGPFSVLARPAEKELRFAEFLEATILTPFQMFDNGEIRPLVGQSVSLAVEATRRVRLPLGQSDFCPFLYEGCHILVFAPELDKIGERFMAWLKSRAKTTLSIAGQRVLVVEQMFGKKACSFLFVRPRPNVLLFATDKGYLEDCLTRMRAPDRKRALPRELPEWKEVNTGARCWAVRHFARDQFSAADPSSPVSQVSVVGEDSRAIGMTFWVDRTCSKMAQARYLSSNPKAVQIVKGYWHRPGQGLNVRIARLKPEAISITANVDDVNAESLLLTSFGFTAWDT